MSTDTTTTLTTSRLINGTPDDVFRAWTEPDRLRRWSCPVLTHELFPNAEARDGHQQGWESCLNQLERLLA